MPVQFGIHAANKAPYADDQLIRTGCGCTTLLIAGPDDVPRARALRARRSATELTIILRPFFVSNIHMKQTPEEIADKCYEMVKDLFDVTTHVTLGNEFNVETPDFDQYAGDSWKEIAAWKLRLYKRFRELAPRCDLHLSAESWACGDEAPAGVLPGLAHQRPVAEMCDYVDAHTYWRRGKNVDKYEGMRFLYVREIFPDTPMYITEAGPTDIKDEQNATAEIEAWNEKVKAYPWLCGYSLFMMNWGPEHPELNYADKASLLQRLADMPKERRTGRIRIGKLLENFPEWVMTREFGFADPQYAGGWHKGTDFALPNAGGGTAGARLLCPFGDVAPDVTAWRDDRGWYGYWRQPAQFRLDVGKGEPQLDLAFFACHLQHQPTPTPCPHDNHLGLVGNTGTLTTGAHLHAGLCEEETIPPYAVVRWIDLLGAEVEKDGW